MNMLNIHMPRYERIWLLIGSGTLVVFLVIVGIMGFYLGMHPPGDMKTIAPEAVRTTPPFDQPGLSQIGPNEYRGAMIAQMFTFLPGNITIPVGSTVHFEVTSPDVVHGLQIPGTNVNMLVVPGHVTQFTYTFKKAGEYLVLCNEYCGTGHQLMMSKIIVQ
jgi:cytochrome c oxidase subunit 2